MWLLFVVSAAVVALGVDGCGPENIANSVSVLRNKGDGTFETRLDYRAGKNPVSVAIGDLNGDGKADIVTANGSGNTVSVFLADSSAVCVVPSVAGKKLPAAKQAIGQAGCRVGKIRRAYSKRVRNGRVVSSAPRPHRVLHGGGKVNLVVSRGRKR